ncbi:MAG: NADPH:quinone reductase [Planktotalea sp.]|uniref:NADPH:quinone reductase n=1 Tax=Planktotalea sp. TaxID=2029877 RepID=UPI00261595C7|nr:NADPH:quinone reductase [Planktotalea sp.]MDG1076470.1 NADPH:quinone reductase [Planktotalea sp.]
MRAIGYSEFGIAGDVLALHDVALPEPAAGEVRVKLVFSGVNPSDAKARGGTRPGVLKPPFDLVVPHSDGAGVIDAVGAGVDPARIGARVWIWNGQWQRAFGTAAEAICVPSEQAVALPEGASLEAGATLGIPGLTAAHTVFGGGDIAGQTLFISGGAGAVGHNAVQLAKWGGARVIATASPNAFERVTDAGADHVLEYRAPDLAAQILSLTDGKGVDRAVEVEFGANAPLLAEVVCANGTIAAYGSQLDMAPTLPFGSFLFKAITIDIVLVYILDPAPRVAAIEKLLAALSQGALTPEIHEIMPLEDAALAHERVMTSGRSGAVLLKI